MSLFHERFRRIRRHAGSFLLILISLTLLLGGCATLNETQCVQADWFMLGASDARNGYTIQRIDQHQQACSKHGIRIDPRAYEAGYGEGLKDFCVPTKGFSQGRNGNDYQNQCPAPLERDFLRGYDLGRQVHAVEVELEAYDKQIKQLQADIDNQTSEQLRDAAKQRLRFVIEDRDRTERQRNNLLERSRRLGFSSGW